VILVMRKHLMKTVRSLSFKISALFLTGLVCIAIPSISAQTTSEYNKALMSAIDYNDSEKIQSLIEKGADVNYQNVDMDGETALIRASSLPWKRESN